MSTEKRETYSTTSFYLGAFLIAKGMQLIGLNQTGDFTRRDFVFVDFPEREKLVNEYNFNHQAEVNVRDFVSAIRQLKSLLHEPK